MTDEPKPFLSEQVTDVHGSHRRDWYCQPPAEGTVFHVTRSTWTPDGKVQKVYEIRIGEAW
jgi:hypothetical protein